MHQTCCRIDLPGLHSLLLLKSIQSKIPLSIYCINFNINCCRNTCTDSCQPATWSPWTSTHSLSAHRVTGVKRTWNCTGKHCSTRLHVMCHCRRQIIPPPNHRFPDRCVLPSGDHCPAHLFCRTCLQVKVPSGHWLQRKQLDWCTHHHSHTDHHSSGLSSRHFLAKVRLWKWKLHWAAEFACTEQRPGPSGGLYSTEQSAASADATDGDHHSQSLCHFRLLAQCSAHWSLRDTAPNVNGTVAQSQNWCTQVNDWTN